MLDVGRRFTLEDVVIFGDSDNAAAFYALPSTPRIALDDHGSPELNLVVYGASEGQSFISRGGICTLTTSLELSSREAQQVAAELRQRTGGHGGQLLVPDIVRAAVSVSLADGVRFDGTPSLAGGFRCAFNTKLDAQQASALRSALEQGLTNATATYRLDLRPGPGATSLARDLTIEGRLAYPSGSLSAISVVQL
jgi:hypothetical protein